jgi:hypothetical protein
MSPNKFKTQQLVAAKSQTNSATTTANFDTLGADFASIMISFGAELNTNAAGPTVSVLSSDDTVVTNFATVVANRTEDLANAHHLVYWVDTKYAKRYLRLSVTTGGTTNDNITFAAIGSLHKLEEAPQNTTEMVASTNDAVVLV